MESKRVKLEVGSLYTLHGRDCEGFVLECVREVGPDNYSDYNAKLRSVKTGWTMVAHGVNMYEDGTIDWDFSTCGIFTRKENGRLIQVWG